VRGALGRRPSARSQRALARAPPPPVSGTAGA
jgi:hypothetical protein